MFVKKIKKKITIISIWILKEGKSRRLVKIRNRKKIEKLLASKKPTQKKKQKTERKPLRSAGWIAFNPTRKKYSGSGQANFSTLPEETNVMHKIYKIRLLGVRY